MFLYLSLRLSKIIVKTKIKIINKISKPFLLKKSEIFKRIFVAIGKLLAFSSKTSIKVGITFVKIVITTPIVTINKIIG